MDKPRLLAAARPIAATAAPMRRAAR